MNTLHDMMVDSLRLGLGEIIVQFGITVILPITLLYLHLRQKKRSDNNKKEIILAALEKNTNIDIEELMRKLNMPDKLLKEKLLKKLQWGLLTSFLGIGLSAVAAYLGFVGGSSPSFIYMCGIGGTVLIAIGVAFIISYNVGKKMLAKEIEKEEQNLRQA